MRRSNKLNLSIECKPIKLPRDNPTSKLSIAWFYKKNGLIEKNYTQQNADIWILNCVCKFRNTVLHAHV